MDITRYDGTRLITLDEIDREFTGKWVLVRLDEADPWDCGYLVASADGADEMYLPMDDIAVNELNANAKIYYGCTERGNLHVQLLG
ncbi:MAG: hypothetical protein FWG87_02290 [Defluviitaleaceae bacterium]|nr:hypothetical protein [Defluviitaleaceae bacterium]